MAEEKKNRPQETELPINERLLEDCLKFKEERRLLKERLAKIEASQEDVTKSVFKKVHSDYSARLQKATDKLLEKKQDIDRELATLYETRDKIQTNLTSHKETLEEIKFRYKLGEFSKEEFQAKAKAEDDKVARFEQVFSSVQANIKRYENLFAGEEDIFGSMPEAKSPLVDVGEGVDEWELESKETALENLPSLEEGVAKSATTSPETKEWLEATKPNIEDKAKITIISGHDNVGKSFPVQGELTIGRSHNNQIILRDAKVSRQHAEVKTRGSEYIIIDLNSSNGTLVNGQKVHEHILSPSDEIQIGDFILQFQQ